jgi:DNA (cytosine-5)-methyltransferase 1
MSASFPTYQPRLLYIDLFCGAGGVTTGVSRVPGVQVVACVNHDATAIASHAANHPDALHYTEDIRTLDISPIAARVAMLRLRYPDTKVVLWASCECTNFSRAKGGKTRDPDSRSLAEHLYRYIKALQPDYIQIENVTEFLEWGPMLEKDGKLVPDKARKGESFKLWFFHILDMGYSGDWRIFNAADFGAYTSRKRLFVQFGRYGLPLAWPVPTHSRENWKPCRDVLDLDAPVGTLCTKQQKYPVTAIFMASYYSGGGQISATEAPCPALTTVPKPRVVQCQFLDQQFGKSKPASLNRPSPAIMTNSHYSVATASFIRAMMRPGVKGLVYPLDKPMKTLLTRDYFYLDTCRYTGCPNYSQDAPGDTEAMLTLKRAMRERGIADICMRPLSIRECLRVMGFPEDYKLCGTQTQQRKFIGNAVEVHMAYEMALSLHNALKNQYTLNQKTA